MRHPLLLVLLIGALALALSFYAGLTLAPRAYTPDMTYTANAIIPALDLRPLAEITPTGDPRDVARYCGQADVKAVFSDDLRARALCAMYLVHVAKPYGVGGAIDTLAQFLALDYAPCSDYALAEIQILRALGIPSRVRHSVSHTWTEAQIAGVWETFDATTNVWLGADRAYRMFYTPAADMSTSYEYRAYINSQFNVLKLRADEPFTRRGE